MRKEFASFGIAISRRRKSCSHASWNFTPRILWQKCTSSVRWNTSGPRPMKRGMRWKYSSENNDQWRSSSRAERSGVEGSRHEPFKATPRDPSVRAGLAFTLGMTAFSFPYGVWLFRVKYSCEKRAAQFPFFGVLRKGHGFIGGSVERARVHGNRSG